MTSGRIDGLDRWRRGVQGRDAAAGTPAAADRFDVFLSEQAKDINHARLRHLASPGPHYEDLLDAGASSDCPRTNRGALAAFRGARRRGRFRVSPLRKCSWEGRCVSITRLDANGFDLTKSEVPGSRASTIDECSERAGKRIRM